MIGSHRTTPATLFHSSSYLSFFFFLQCYWKHLSVTEVSTNTFLNFPRILVTSLAFFSWQRCTFRHWRRRWKEDRRRWQNQLRSQVCVINELPKLVVLFLTRSTLKRKTSFSCSCSFFVIGILHQDLVGCYLQTERICWICGLSLIILRYIYHWRNVFSKAIEPVMESTSSGIVHLPINLVV